MNWLARRFRSRALRRFFAQRVVVVGLVFVVALLAFGYLGPVIDSTRPSEQNLRARNVGPSSEHWLGTDLFGRDLLARLMEGTQVTLEAALVALVVATLTGVPFGLLAGYRRGVVDAVLNRIADALLSLPGLILALAIIAVRGPGLVNAMIAVGVVLSPRFFRVARGAALTVADEVYVEAARADGASSARILRRHVLPNSSGPLLVQMSFALGFAVTAEASLSFIGLGVELPTPSWGSMLREAFTQINRSSWQLYPPSIMIALTVFVFAVLGDALRDAFGRNKAGS